MQRNKNLSGITLADLKKPKSDKSINWEGAKLIDLHIYKESVAKKLQIIKNTAKYKKGDYSSVSSNTLNECLNASSEILFGISPLAIYCTAELRLA